MGCEGEGGGGGGWVGGLGFPGAGDAVECVGVVVGGHGVAVLVVMLIDGQVVLHFSAN